MVSKRTGTLAIASVVGALIVGLSLVWVTKAHAEDGPPVERAEVIAPQELAALQSAPSPKMSLDLSIRSAYVANTAGVTFSNHPVGQANFTFYLPNGFYVNPWASTSLSKGWDKDGGSEVDLSVGKTGKLKNGCGYDVGFGYYNLYPVRSINGGDVLDLYGEFNCPFWKADHHSLGGFAKLELLEFSRQHGSYKGDYLLSFGVDHASTYGPWSIIGRAKLVKDPGIFGLQPGMLLGYGGRVGYDVSKTVTVIPFGYQLTMPLTMGDNDPRRTRNVFWAGVSFRWY